MGSAFGPDETKGIVKIKPDCGFIAVRAASPGQTRPRESSRIKPDYICFAVRAASPGRTRPKESFWVEPDCIKVEEGVQIQ